MGDAMAELPQEFYTVKELAKLLRVTEMTIYRLVKRGEIATYHIGRVMRFRRDDIEGFLEKHRSNRTT